MLHFTSRQSLVQLIMTCSLINSSGDCSSCMRGGTPSRTVRVCKEEPEAMLVRTHAASNWRERVQQVVGELAANNHHTQYQYMATEKVNKTFVCLVHSWTQALYGAPKILWSGKLSREKLSRIGKNTIFAKFADCSLLPCQRTPHPKISWRKLSQIATKPQN